MESMLDHIAPGGVYIVEDIIDQNFVKYVINKYVIGEQSLSKFRWHAHLTQTNLPPPQRQLYSVTFYPFVLVVEKLAQPREQFRPDQMGDAHIQLEGHGGFKG